MAVAEILLGASPGKSCQEKAQLASGRALRTLLQGIAGAFPSAGVGSAVLETGYWQTLGFACLAALVAGVVSFLHNAAVFLPMDPTQKSAT